MIAVKKILKKDRIETIIFNYSGYLAIFSWLITYSTSEYINFGDTFAYINGFHFEELTKKFKVIKGNEMGYILLQSIDDGSFKEIYWTQLKDYKKLTI